MIRDLSRKYQDTKTEKALKSQEQYREKEIIKFYVTGRPIFNSTRDVQRTLMELGYVSKKYSTF